MKFTLLLILCILVTCYADDTNAKRNRRKSSGRGGSSRSGNSNSSGRGSSSGSGNSNSSGRGSSSGSGNSNSSGRGSSSRSGNSNSSGKSSSSRSGNSNSSGKSSSSGSSSSNKPTGGISSNRSPGRSSSSRSSISDLSKAVKDSGSRMMNYAKGYYQGAKEMVKSYQEMRKANVIGSDKYFHSKGNFNAAKFGPGGVAAAEDISNLREATDKARYMILNILGKMSDSEYNEKIKDSNKDQEANTWGRSGKDPNKYRVNGIPNGM